MAGISERRTTAPRSCWSPDSVLLFVLIVQTLIPAIAALATTTNSRNGRNLLILGLGRVGQEVAKQAKPYFDSIIGTVHADKHQEILDGGDDGTFRCVAFSRQAIEPLLQPSSSCATAPVITHVLTTIPPPVEKDQLKVVKAVYDTVATLLPDKSWVGMISTTGVYGNHFGDWVTEASDCRCGGYEGYEMSSASRLWFMEQEWQQRATSHGHCLRIFRCAGIYGPGRSALHTLYRQGWNGVVRNNNVGDEKARSITNRIHSHDLVRALIGSMLIDHDSEQQGVQTRSPRVYNLADDLPENRQVVMQYARELFQAARIALPREARSREASSTSSDHRRPAARTTSSNRARRRGTDQKRVSNRRMKEELFAGEGLKFPTYKEGLQAILRDQDSPW